MQQKSEKPEENKEQEQPKQPPKKQVPSPAGPKYPKDTPNGGMIRNMMKSTKQKGNPKDFVILVGNRLIDWWGSYDVMYQPEGENEAKKMGVDGVALLHKRILHNILPAEIASQFWNKKLRMRVPQKPPPPGKKNEQTKQG